MASPPPPTSSHPPRFCADMAILEMWIMKKTTKTMDWENKCSGFNSVPAYILMFTFKKIKRPERQHLRTKFSSLWNLVGGGLCISAGLGPPLGSPWGSWWTWLGKVGLQKSNCKIKCMNCHCWFFFQLLSSIKRTFQPKTTFSKISFRPNAPGYCS